MEKWEPLLEKYLAYTQKYEKSRPPPATLQESDRLLSLAERFGLVIDPSYIALLKKVNGTGFDGLFFCGVCIPENDRYGRIDLVAQNELIDERGDDTIYGLWQDEFFVRVASTGQFERRSVATAEDYYVYSTCEELLTAVLAEQVGYMDELLSKAP